MTALNQPCCAVCSRYTKAVCDSRDQKCEAFRSWFLEARPWSAVTEMIWRMVR